MIKRKGATKSDIIIALKSNERAIGILHHRLSSMEIVLDKYIDMNGDSEDLKKYFDKIEKDNLKNEDSGGEKESSTEK